MAEEGKVIASHTFEAWTEQFEKANRGKQLIVLDFSAAWCPHSRSMSPMLAELAKKMPNVTFLMVDANELCAVAMEWAVKVVPTFFFLKQGQLLDQFVGANVKQLISTIERHAGGAHGILESMTCNLPTMSNSAIIPNAANPQWTIPTNYPQPQVLIGTSSFHNPQMLPNYSILGTNNGFPV
ncbi:thioredoxin H1-like [Manihot esculenta]|uniref:Uncharacterized protein n=1 Tax=Manihot esculenta TaxID=3983 RepID=A0ACB7GSR2_MANES|nr:thioredoxin H1-like [Manihot esculenta]KAG8643442.1 hypothetical protein MANES_11G039992v8 [Manihot esculenta]